MVALSESRFFKFKIKIFSILPKDFTTLLLLSSGQCIGSADLTKGGKNAGQQQLGEQGMRNSPVDTKVSEERGEKVFHALQQKFPYSP